jgi:mannosyl-oligosaccharide alpha-1,2-mannosidase
MPLPRRRYRLFFVCAVVIVFMLYRVSQNSEWDPTSYTSPQPNKFPHQETKQEPVKEETKSRLPPVAEKKPEPAVEKHPVEDTLDATGEYTVKIPQLKTSYEHPGTYGLPTLAPEITKAPAADATDARPVETTKAAVKEPDDDTEDIHWKNPPGAVHETLSAATTTNSQIHWAKMLENFPVPEESIIPLPTGKPKQIRTVQYNFGGESETAKETRLKRLGIVKAEMQRAWGGYRKYAWMHDELSPTSKKYRDPFCGWAATLVDGLDTLWIMGMYDEFDEAAKAVRDIDFTYSSVRKDIPVFETIIRYLGGLVAAYDVSGGKQSKYPILLEKAQELAEILMGVFDTPNRMPILYYHWQPEYVSQRHRAATGSVAELGSMTMEFTRLAQLTGKQKYYDAAARITDAFEDLQNRGTTLNGIFPESLDASGCNRTAYRLQKEEYEREALAAAAPPVDEPQGYVPGVSGSDERDYSKMPLYPEATQQSDSAKDQTTTAPEEELRFGNGSEPTELKKAVSKRQVKVDAPNGSSGVDTSYPGGVAQGPFDANGQDWEWDCPSQGLTSGGYGFESYGMGGSQDSTYEYYPKVRCVRL